MEALIFRTYFSTLDSLQYEVDRDIDLSHSMYIFSTVKRSGKICSDKVYKNNRVQYELLYILVILLLEPSY